METLKEDVDGYFYVKKYSGSDIKARRHLTDTYNEADKTVGPSSFVSKWHNNGNDLARTKKPSKYTEGYKIEVTNECVKNNITLVQAAKKYNIAHATIKNWFCIYEVRARRMQHLRKRARNLASKGKTTVEVADALGISVRSARSYIRGV